MIVGPHSTKLPQSRDTGSDPPSVPENHHADFDYLDFSLHVCRNLRFGVVHLLLYLDLRMRTSVQHSDLRAWIHIGNFR